MVSQIKSDIYIYIYVLSLKRKKDITRSRMQREDLACRCPAEPGPLTLHPKLVVCLNSHGAVKTAAVVNKLSVFADRCRQ